MTEAIKDKLIKDIGLLTGDSNTVGEMFVGTKKIIEEYFKNSKV